MEDRVSTISVLEIMQARAIKNIVAKQSRSFSGASEGFKVAVCGASGGIGQPMSMLLKLTQQPISHLSLYDIVGTPGVAADLSHCSSPGQVTGHVGPEQLDEALTGCDVVVIPAGVPRKPGMTRDDLFNTNASIVQSLAEGVAKNCPNAMVAIISNPVNSTVPIVAETMKRHGVYNPKRLFGVTTLDVVRAERFVAETQGWNPRETDVTVIGGHAGITILPLLSRVQGAEFSQEQIEALTHRIQFGGDEVVKAKDGAGSATLSMAYAGARFTESLLAAMNGESITECCFVESDATELPFFSTPCELSADGVKSVGPVGELSDFEKANFEKMIPELQKSIEKGIDFVKNH